MPITLNFKTGRSGVRFAECPGSPSICRDKDGISVTGMYYVAWADEDQFCSDMLGETQYGFDQASGIAYTKRILPTSFPNKWPPADNSLTGGYRPIYALKTESQPLPGLPAYEDYGPDNAQGQAVLGGEHGQQVVAVNLTNAGANYLFAPDVVFIGDGGESPEAIADMSGGSVANVQVIQGGSGYEIPPLVRFSGGGSATGGRSNSYDYAKVTIEYGTVLHVVGNNTGALAPQLFAQDIAPNGGLYNTIIKYSVAGKDITLPPQQFLFPQGPSAIGSGATATGVVNGGVLTGINITAPGTGYVVANSNGQFPASPWNIAVVIIGGGGFNAAAVVTAVDNNGGVTAITITNPGFGYTSAPAVLIFGGQPYNEQVPFPIPNSQVTFIRKACASIPNAASLIGTLNGPLLNFNNAAFAGFPHGSLRFLSMETEPANTSTGQRVQDLTILTLYQPNVKLVSGPPSPIPLPAGTILGHNAFPNFNIQPRDYQSIYGVPDGQGPFSFADWSPLYA